MNPLVRLNEIALRGISGRVFHQLTMLVPRALPATPLATWSGIIPTCSRILTCRRVLASLHKPSSNRAIHRLQGTLARTATRMRVLANRRTCLNRPTSGASLNALNGVAHFYFTSLR